MLINLVSPAQLVWFPVWFHFGWHLSGFILADTWPELKIQPSIILGFYPCAANVKLPSLRKSF